MKTQVSAEERRSTFAHAPGDVDMCANCRRHQQQHFWVCNSCGFERSPGEDGLPSELCEHPESRSCTLVCPLQRIPKQMPIGTSDTWPLYLLMLARQSEPPVMPRVRLPELPEKEAYRAPHEPLPEPPMREKSVRRSQAQQARRKRNRQERSARRKNRK